MKVLYIFAGERKVQPNKTICVDFPDSDFYGLNYLKNFGINAEFREPNKILRSLFGFRISHILMYFRTFGYDLVFGPAILYLMILRKIWPNRKTKFVLLNISLGRTVAIYKEKKLLWFIKFLLEDVDHCVCLSKFQEDFLLENVPVLKGKTSVICLGVDTKFYKNIEKIRNGPILSVGKDDGRDYKTVFEVAKLLPEETFEVICHPRNIKKLGKIPSNVSLKFMAPITELKEKYQSAKALLLTTHNDNFNEGADCSGQTVLLEAMASGMPIIASRKKYISEYVGGQESAILVDFYDSRQIAEKIILLKQNDQMASTLSRNACEKVNKNFSTEKMAENLANLFKELNKN